MIKLYFTDYRISTITSNIDILYEEHKCKIDLFKLFSEIDISMEDKSFVWTHYVFDNQETTRGIYPKKRRNNKKGIKRKFDNQISFIFKMRDGYYPNIKVFQNGNIQMTGPRSLDDIYIPLHKMLEQLKKHHVFSDEVLDYSNICFSDLKIRLINTDFKIYKDPELTEKFFIKRKILHRILTDKEKLIASFDSNTYPGVKISYYWDINNHDKDGKFKRNKMIIGKNKDDTIRKISICCFESSSIIITGAISLEQVNEAYSFIKKIIQIYANEIILNI